MLTHFLRRANRPRIARPDQFPKLKLEQLEARDVPALWAVHLTTPGSGMPGDSAATFSGGFAINTMLPTNANGDTLVEADSQAAAVAQALVGTVTAQVGSQSFTYALTPGSIGSSAAEHRPFVLSNGSLWLEDLAYSTGSCDWDYNDRVWMISVNLDSGGGGSPPYGYPTMVWFTQGVGTTETSPTNGWFVVSRNNTAGELTVNFGVVASTATDTATLDVDYNILGNGSSVTFAAGAADAMIYIHPMIDAIGTQYEQQDDPELPYESGIELVTLALLGGSGYTVYSPAQASIQLGNDKLVFDLDVDHDGILGVDGIDLAKNYLPGYKAGTAMVSTGTSFNVPAYEGQWMRLVINGAGKDSIDHVNKVEFIIAQVSADPGYTGNRTDPSLEGVGNTEDYSFRRNGREGADLGVASKITVERNVNTSNDNLYGGAYGGNMEATSTWVNFWCKDYGGAARLQAKVYIADANAPGGERIVTRALSVPLDNDFDGIADKWEIAMGARWSAQYGIAALTPQEAKDKFNNFDDIEEKDPDKAGTTAQGPLREQAETGDAHTVKEEYRGYILDGGGLNGAGGGVHTGGHIRLDPARKEILVEVDRAAVLNNIPGADGLKGILNSSSGVFSNTAHGAGIYMYWLMDEDTLVIPKADIDTTVKAVYKARDTRNTPLTSDFMHLLFIDEGITGPFGNAIGVTFGRAVTNLYRDALEWTGPQQLAARGSLVGTTDVNAVSVADIPNRSGLLIWVIAHELTHQLGGVHTGNDNDSDCIMNETANKKVTDPATIKFSSIVQGVLRTKSGEWGTL